jgi:nucleoside-specific outer membrane channel protein Tsx
MAFANGGSIVTNGLVLALDAADRNSYVSGSTIWSDLSGNGYNATLTNGPTFTTGSGGGIVYDGTDDYAVGNNSLASQISSAVTIISFANIRNMSARSPIFSKYSTSSPFGYVLEIGTVGGSWTNTMRFYAAGNNSNNSTDYRGTVSLNSNQTYMFTATFNQSTQVTRMYYNTTEMSANQAGNNTTDSGWSQGSGNYTLASYRPFFNIDAPMTQFNCLIYNRVLSLGEIEQIYNATKTRFGL